MLKKVNVTKLLAKRLVVFLLLLPFSLIYGLITDIRNWLFDNKLSAVYRPEVPVISVGNLTVGGTGKTPMVEYLIKRHLSNGPNLPYETVILSRGYGRLTKGFRIATDADTAATLGDEPLQLYRKFKQYVYVCVGERRAFAIQQLQALYPATKYVVLDDAFQHRAVQRDLDLVLTDYKRPFYNDYPFPAGHLRERRHGAKRAHAIVVTKCPLSLPIEEQAAIRSRIQQYCAGEAPIFFAGLQYGVPVSFATREQVTDLRSVILVSGLANADPLEEYVRQTFRLQKHLRFADHHAYTRAELDQLISKVGPEESLLTTEKDWVKLDALLTNEERMHLPFYYLPVEMVFLPGYQPAFEVFIQGKLWALIG